MEQYVIKGGNPLVGEVEIGGAKNAALGILAAAIMTDETVVIDNLPDVQDINVLLEAISVIGARVDRISRHKVAINGFIDALNTAGVQCAVFSNKADPLCGKIIEHYFGAGRFVLVRGSRPGVPTKPDPAGLYALMEQIHADPAATLFVGDSDVDILTGHNAHLPAMGALWGFRGRAELTAAGADALAAVPEDIWAYIQERNK